MAGNFTLPINATSTIDWIRWTNQIAGTDYAIGIFVLFFAFILPLIFLLSLKNELFGSLTTVGIATSVIMFFLSLEGLIPSDMVIIMFVFTGINFMMLIFKDRKQR